MAFIPSLLSSANPFMHTLTTVSCGITSLTASAAHQFFTNLFYHPGQYPMPIMILGGVTVAACVGVAFLVKMAYDKFCTETTRSPSI